MSRELPARPSLDHLKNEAKALLKAFDAGDATARRRIRDALGEHATLKLADAQRALAREYGFPTWARLNAHVKAARGIADATDAFLVATQMQDLEGARRTLAQEPRIATESLHVAAVLGSASDARRLIEADPARVSQKAGNPAADPLLFLCYSPFHGESAGRDASLLETAKVLLDSGANPNTVDGRYGVPALYAVTGMHNVLPIAKLLLARGANPTDGESVFHAAERFHEDALELLLDAGVDLNYVGDWGNTALYFILRWHDVEKEEKPRLGIRWLLDHGADPNILCGKERENALHAAARHGRGAAIVRELLAHGADVNARNGDGATAWLLARRAGNDDVAEVLERAGAKTQALSPLDELLAACGRGDTEAARRLTSPALIAELSPTDRLLLLNAASTDRVATVEACVAAGWPVGDLDGMGATAIHHAAMHGRAKLVRSLLGAGSDVTIRDKEHDATPLGWAVFGADHVAVPDGDYVAVLEALRRTEQ